jgi:hypothetical protein
MSRPDPDASTRGHNSARLGAIAERYAAALLERHFDHVARPERDIGVDFFGVRSLGDGIPPVPFRFQVKHGNRFPIRARSAEEFLETVEHSPTVFLHVDPGFTPSIRFLILHSWMLDHPDWPARIRTSKTVHFALGEFEPIGATHEPFCASVDAEVARVLKLPGAPFQTRSPTRLPLSESDMFREMGHLGQFEVPSRVLTEVRQLPSLYSQDMGFLRRAVNGREERSALTEAESRQWLERVAQTPDADAADKEQREFLRFAKSLRAAGQNTDFAMPGYRWNELSPWRVFVEMYPESFLLLERMYQAPGRWSHDQLSGGFILLGALATGDGPLASKAHTLLRRLDRAWPASIGPRYDDYQIARAYRFAVAEAAVERRSQSRFLDFLAKRSKQGGDNHELTLHRRYYDTSSLKTVKAYVTRKLDAPKPRDENTLRITQALVDTYLV